MPEYLAPGVYVEEVPSGSRSIEGAGTSVTAFVGAANRGPTGAAELLGSFSDYEAIFGPVGNSADLMGLAVRAFFTNGGRSAYVCRLVDGDPVDDDYRGFFEQELVKFHDVSVLVLPGKAMDPAGKGAIDHAVAHCERTKRCMLIVDTPGGTELKTAGDVDTLGLSTSTFVVTYYPWVKVDNPEYDPELNPEVNPLIAVAASAFAAGVWSRIDGTRGVWSSPAGVNAQLLGAQDLEFDVGEHEQARLNPEGVNCIRRVPGRGLVFWGSRTRSTEADEEWRYVTVQRTAIFIEQSIYNGIRWAVFEPNDHRLWSSLRSNIEGFMNRLFRLGAFQGETASLAYFVRCGLGSTMTQTDVDSGRVVVLVGFAPVKPAEFAIVRIQQMVGQE